MVYAPYTLKDEECENVYNIWNDFAAVKPGFIAKRWPFLPLCLLKCKGGKLLNAPLFTHKFDISFLSKVIACKQNFVLKCFLNVLNRLKRHCSLAKCNIWGMLYVQGKPLSGILFQKLEKRQNNKNFYNSSLIQ